MAFPSIHWYTLTTGGALQNLLCVNTANNSIVNVSSVTKVEGRLHQSVRWQTMQANWLNVQPPDLETISIMVIQFEM